jgi:hypothetical protein
MESHWIFNASNEHLCIGVQFLTGEPLDDSEGRNNQWRPSGLVKASKSDSIGYRNLLPQRTQCAGCQLANAGQNSIGR